MIYFKLPISKLEAECIASLHSQESSGEGWVGLLVGGVAWLRENWGSETSSFRVQGLGTTQPQGWGGWLDFPSFGAVLQMSAGSQGIELTLS